MSNTFATGPGDIRITNRVTGETWDIPADTVEITHEVIYVDVARTFPLYTVVRIKARQYPRPLQDSLITAPDDDVAPVIVEDKK